MLVDAVDRVEGGDAIAKGSEGHTHLLVAGDYLTDVEVLVAEVVNELVVLSQGHIDVPGLQRAFILVQVGHHLVNGVAVGGVGHIPYAIGQGIDPGMAASLCQETSGHGGFDALRVEHGHHEVGVALAHGHLVLEDTVGVLVVVVVFDVRTNPPQDGHHLGVLLCLGG